MTRKRILVPINFTVESDAALVYARQIADGMKEMISCLYVIEDQEQTAIIEVDFESKHKIRREAEQRLSMRVHEILSKEHQTEFELIITSGKVHQKVLEKARDLDARLIVMGKSDSFKNKKKTLGSNTQQILLKSPTPVITVYDSGKNGISNLVLPLDLNESNTYPLKHAIEFAFKFPVNIIVVSILPNGMKSLHKIFQDKLDHIINIFKNLKIPCEMQLIAEKTSITEDIISFMKNIDDGFMMMMTKELSAKEKEAIGTCAQELIVKSDIPVFCLNETIGTEKSNKDDDFTSKSYTSSRFVVKEN